MKLLIDCFGRQVRLTDERLGHILEHPEMLEMEAQIDLSINDPQLVRRSLSDRDVMLFYRFCPETPVGGKWLCIVVKYAQNDAFIVTAYLTNQPKPGEDQWPTK